MSSVKEILTRQSDLQALLATRLSLLEQQAFPIVAGAGLHPCYTIANGCEELNREIGADIEALK